MTYAAGCPSCGCEVDQVTMSCTGCCWKESFIASAAGGLSAVPPEEKRQVRVGASVIVWGMSDYGVTGKILIGKRKGSHGAGLWSLPGGKMEHGEEPAKAAARELLEETGLQTETRRFLPHPFNSFVDERGQHWITLMFQCWLPDGVEPMLMEPEKCGGWQWVHTSHLRDFPLFQPLEMLARARAWI